MISSISITATATFTYPTPIELRNVLVYAAVIVAVGVIIVLILRDASTVIGAGPMAVALPSIGPSVSEYSGPAIHGFSLARDK